MLALRKRLNFSFFTAYLLFMVPLGLAGCNSFTPPQTSGDYEFKKRLATETQGDISVTVGVPTRSEAKQIFAADVYAENMQPIWVLVENKTDKKLALLPSSIDQEYYSPNEAAYKTNSGYSSKGQKDREIFFNQMSLPYYIPPFSSGSGYIFTRMDEGNKFVTVDLLTGDDLKRFDFILDLTEVEGKYRQGEIKDLYSRSDLTPLTLDELKETVIQLPCCTLGPKSGNMGNPLNVVIVGNQDDALSAFVRNGWRRQKIKKKRYTTRPPYFLSKRPYRYLGDGEAFVYERVPDAIFEKPREDRFENNVLKIWVTPFLYQGKHIFIGSLTRNIGVRFSVKSPYLNIHHKIDSDVDESRELLLEELISISAIDAVGWVKGMEKSSPDNPRPNYLGDHWFTDGLRLVLFISEYPVRLKNVELLDWEIPSDIKEEVLK